MSQELAVAAGGVRRPTLWTLQEALVQQVDDFGRRRGAVGVVDAETLKLQAVVGTGL